MKPFEIILSVKLRAKDVSDAHATANKLAEALTAKLGPATCQCVWSIREDEFPKVEKKA